jgi:PAS domain S-box-containing protein
VLRDSGYTREEFVGKTPQELGLFADPVAFQRLGADLATQGHVGGLPMRLRSKDGSTIDVLLSATVVGLGDELGLLAAVLNVTDLKRAEDALRQSEALLNEVGRIAKIGGWSVDLATGILSWTDEIYALYEVDEGFDPPSRGPSISTRPSAVR